MVGIVIVSHSFNLAQNIIEFVKEMQFSDFPLINGSGIENATFGSDPLIILDAIKKAYTKDGVIILCDIGSSILNTKIAIDFLEENYDKNKIIIADAPIVEGALVAVSSNVKSENVLNKILDELEKLKTMSKLD